MANKESSLPEQQILKRDGGTGSPVPSTLCLSQQQDRAWGSHSPHALQLRLGMYFRREPVKSRRLALQEHLALSSAVISSIVLPCE